MLETKRPSGGNFAAEFAMTQLDLKGFAADQRMGEVDRIRDAVTGPGIDADKLVTFMKLDLAANAVESTGTTLATESGVKDEVNEWLGAAVEDGKFQIVELDVGVIQTDANTRGEQVFGGGYQHALLHQ